MPEETVPSPTEIDGARLAEKFEQLWLDGEPALPDPFQFLEDAGPCPAGVTARILALDQWMRWQAGERPSAEEYLRLRPDLMLDPEHAVHLVYGELLVRESLGERVEPEEYLRRFPLLADRLRQQLELHRALKADRTHHWAPAPGESGGTRLGSEPFSTFEDEFREVAEGEAGPSVEASLETERPPKGMPESFGRYLIRKRLGEGGMGTVYLAEDRLLGRTVALKVPRFLESQDAGLIRRFHREARIAATFDHESLCRIYDVGQIGGRHYFTMPVLTGEPLSARLKREGPLPEHEAARLTVLVSRAMEEAHRLGVIHRDLKPSNVMICEGGSPVVMDFGLAHRTSGGDPRITQTGVLVGTPLYVPPEQVRLGPELPSIAGDIYSLGIMLYEMLTGRTPFQGDRDEVLRQVLTREPEPPSRFRSALDPCLEAICMTAIAREPEGRYRSMAQFAEALDVYLQPDVAFTVAEAVRVVPAPEPEPAGAGRNPSTAVGFSRRHVLVAGLLALAAVTALAAIAAQRVLGPRTDLIQPGTRWSGYAEFAPPLSRSSDYYIQILSRRGKDFEALCGGENGKYQWVIAGTIENETIRWTFQKVVHEAMRTGVVGSASVVGRYRGKEIVATYRDPDSSATLKLTLVE